MFSLLMIVWVSAPCRLAGGCQGWRCRQYAFPKCWYLQPWKWRQYVSAKRWHLSANLYSGKTENNIILIIVKTSYLTWFYLFICGLFNDAFAHIIQNQITWWLIMIWTGCERKRQWPDLMYYTHICLEGLRATTKSVSTSDLRAENWIRNLPCTKES
jgi:hypothetical protein